MIVDATQVALVAELRAAAEQAGKELEAWQRRAKHAVLLAEQAQSELAALRESFEVEADAADMDPDQEARGSRFWYAHWKEMKRKRAEGALRIRALERELEELRCLDLTAFNDGELSPERGEAFREHLERCAECQRGLLSHGQLDARMAELAPPGSPPRSG